MHLVETSDYMRLSGFVFLFFFNVFILIVIDLGIFVKKIKKPEDK